MFSIRSSQGKQQLGIALLLRYPHAMRVRARPCSDTSEIKLTLHAMVFVLMSLTGCAHETAGQGSAPYTPSRDSGSDIRGM